MQSRWVLVFWLWVGSITLADPWKPAPPSIDRATWFQKFSRQQKTLNTGHHRVCFLGDSLTEFWPEHGAGSWRLDLGPFSPVNCGIAADRVEETHYRANLLRFGPAPPEFFVVLAGTNNLSKQTPDAPEAVAGGIRELSRTLRRKCPKARILVLSVLPSGNAPDSPLRQDIRLVNAALSKKSERIHFEFLNVHDHFIDENGLWKPGLTLDGTHLSAKGYEILAGPLAKRLSELLNLSKKSGASSPSR